MCLCLAHEVAHTFGLGEQYDEIEHTELNSGGFYCIMENFDPVNAETYYNALMSGRATAFCSMCQDRMDGIIYGTLHQGNQ